MMINRWIIALFIGGVMVAGPAYAGAASYLPGISEESIITDFSVADKISGGSEINTSKIYSPEVQPLDLRENPVGTLGALQELIDQLISATDEIMHLIDSIFEMLGMEEREEVKDLRDALEDGRSLVSK